MNIYENLFYLRNIHISFTSPLFSGMFSWRRHQHHVYDYWGDPDRLNPNYKQNVTNVDSAFLRESLTEQNGRIQRPHTKLLMNRHIVLRYCLA